MHTLSIDILITTIIISILAMDVESEDSHNSDLEKSAMNIDEWGIVEQRETFYEDDNIIVFNQAYIVIFVIVKVSTIFSNY